MSGELGIGVIGVGLIGGGHAGRVAESTPGAKLVAVSDISDAAAENVARKYGARREPDPLRLIAADDVDAVIIASWDRTHEEYALACLASGKFTLCEKPLAASSRGCLNIVDAEIRGGRRLLDVGFMRRYDSGYAQMKRALDGGTVGNALVVHAQHRNKRPQGEKHTTEMTATASLVHEFDIIRWLLVDEYESVRLACPRQSRNADPDLLDPQVAYLRTRNGVCVDLEMFMNGWYGYDLHCEVVGEKATVRLPVPANLVWLRDGFMGQEVFSSWSQRFENAYETEIREWVRQIRAGRPRGPSAWDGYMASLAGELALRSLRENRPVEFPETKRPEFYD